MRAIGRVIASLIGFMLAVTAAGLFLLAARVGLTPRNPDQAVWFWGQFVASAGLAIMMIGHLAFVPGMIVILASEILRLRSLVFYLLAGGVLGAAAALGLSGLMPAATNDPGRFTVLLATGFVGGFTYWLAAGRMAGLPSSKDRPPAG